MASQRLVCVYDKKAELHRAVFVEPTRETAMRSFTDAILRGRDSMLRSHPDDYVLVEVGCFDSTSGVIDAWMSPFPLLEASEVLRRAQVDEEQLALVAAEAE